MKLVQNVSLLILFILVSSGYSQQKHALLVGVGDYIIQKHSLLGPKNDVPAVRQLLIEKYGFRPENIEVVQDQEATRSNIVAAFERRLIAPVSAGDIALFYFTGHGTQIKDTDGDEQDGFDEAFLPYDAQSRQTLLTDDDLAALVQRIPTREVVVLIDACHSGTGTRGIARARRVSAQALGIEDEPDTRGLKIIGVNSASADLTGSLVISAAQPDQIAAEYPFLRQAASDSANPFMGAFTFYMLEALRNDTKNQLTYLALTNLIQAALGRDGFEQIPQLEGEGSKPFLMFPNEVNSPGDSPTNGQPTPPSLTATVEVLAVRDDGLTLTAQGGVEMTTGSIYESEGDSATIVRILASNGQTAIGSLIKGQAQPGDKLVETFHFIPQSKLRVALLADSVLASLLRQSLQGVEFVEVVGDAEFRDVDLELIAGQADSLLITPYRNQQKLPEIVAGNVEEAMRKLSSVLENLFAVKSLINLKNPNPSFKVDVQVNKKDYAEVHIGSDVHFTVEVDKDAYVYLFDVDPAGKVTVLFPNNYAKENFLQADSTYKMPAMRLYRLQASGPPGPELIKAIATTQPLQLAVLAADSGDFSGLDASALEISRSIVRQLKSEINRTNTRGLVVLPTAPSEQPIATEGWATDEVLLRILEN